MPKLECDKNWDFRNFSKNKFYFSLAKKPL